MNACVPRVFKPRYSAGVPFRRHHHHHPRTLQWRLPRVHLQCWLPVTTAFRQLRAFRDSYGAFSTGKVNCRETKLNWSVWSQCLQRFPAHKLGRIRKRLGKSWNFFRLWKWTMETEPEKSISFNFSEFKPFFDDISSCIFQFEKLTVLNSLLRPKRPIFLWKERQTNRWNLYFPVRISGTISLSTLTVFSFSPTKQNCSDRLAEKRILQDSGFAVNAWGVLRTDLLLSGFVKFLSSSHLTTSLLLFSQMN